MGWLVYSHTPACIRNEIARLCGGEDDMRRSHPVHISRNGTVWYAAVRVEPKEGRLPSGRDATGDYETDAAGGYTFAAVFLTSCENGECGYKSMDETMGPNEARAPATLLDLLSPTTSQPQPQSSPRLQSARAASCPPTSPPECQSSWLSSLPTSKRAVVQFRLPQLSQGWSGCTLAACRKLPHSVQQSWLSAGSPGVRSEKL